MSVNVSEKSGPEMSGDRARFEAFHRANPEVWRRFESGCLEMIASGRTKFGAPVVWERMRWESSVGSRSGSFRLPNEHRPHYARMFQAAHPELASHIATRPLKSERLLADADGENMCGDLASLTDPESGELLDRALEEQPALSDEIARSLGVSPGLPGSSLGDLEQPEGTGC